jgi:hypothetical protein
MVRCPHDVRYPEDQTGGPNCYCSGCVTPSPVKLGKKLRYDDELGFFTCPLCLSDEFEYHSEDSYMCPRCGFDENYIGVL